VPETAVTPGRTADAAAAAPGPSGQTTGVRRLRLLVLGLACAALAAKVVIAATTGGTDDVYFWQQFANGVRKAGPIDVYGMRFAVRYNHPPPMGWMLVALNGLRDLGLPFPLLIRLPSSLADVGATLLVFEILRTRRDPRTAAVAAGVVALSPVLLLTSGFHGNTDGLFVFFVLLAFWLVADRGMPGWGGLAAAAAIGVKLVPIVALPVLLVCLRTRRDLVRFAAAFAVAVAVPWVPAVLAFGPRLVRNVLQYAGHQENWGVVLLLRRLGDPLGAVALVTGPGRFMILLVSALVPAWWAWRRPSSAHAALGLTLVLFLALSPAWATQYMAWPAAMSLLVGVPVGLAWNLAGGALLLQTYSLWSGGFPPGRARPLALDRAGIALGIVAWLALVAAGALGLRRAAIETLRRSA
jgi:hypothetical protein